MSKFTGTKITETTTRITSGPYTVLVSDQVIFVNTSSNAITINLPSGITGIKYRIINTGSSSNNVTVVPDGSDLLLGINSNILLLDGDVVIIVFETNEGWW